MEIVDHAQATELFSSYWEHDLPPEQLQALEEHLRSCVVCRREYQAFEKTIGGLHVLAHQTELAPAGFVDGVASRVRKRSRGRYFAPRRAIDRIPYEMFSVVMLAVLLAIYLVLQLSNPGALRMP